MPQGPCVREEGGRYFVQRHHDSKHNFVTTTFFCIATGRLDGVDSDSDALTSPVLHSPHALYSPYLDYIPESTHDDVHAPIQNTSPSASIPSSLCSPIVSPRSSLRRSLTHPLEDAMIFAPEPLPGSPPDLTTSASSSKTSKSSSFRTHSSYDSNSPIHDHVDASHFEDIILDDERHIAHSFDADNFDLKKTPNPFTTTYDLRSKTKRPITAPGIRSSSTLMPMMQRDLTVSKRPAYPSPQGQAKDATEVHGLGLGLLPIPAMSRRGFTSPSAPTLGMMSGKANRSSSPGSSTSSQSLPPRFQSNHVQARNGIWLANRERKSQADLERECDEDDGDDVPDDFVLENVPISPRPLEERSQMPIGGSSSSSTASLPPSPDGPKSKEKKEKVKPVGNGTPLVPVEQGSLRSPGTSKTFPHRGVSMGQFPINHDSFQLKGRAKSWNAALSDLSEEAKTLTEALEAHADTQPHRIDHSYPHNSKPRSKSSTRPSEQDTSVATADGKQLRAQSSLAELPPLRRTNIMIDPLPISKEKEAVLSRTRPSWLPPKNPVEEKRHLKEYQRMMASSLATEKRKEEEGKQRQEWRDDTAGSLGRIWEEHVLPNWNQVVGLKRTRELWWRGVAPRSRGTVWMRAIGNELELSDASYQAALSRAKELERNLTRREGSEAEKRMSAWFAAIRRDVQHTYPGLRIFQLGGPLHESLINVLMAYAMYRSDVGYVSGTNTATALLLLNLPTAAASFSTLANALNRPLSLSFLTRDYGAMSRVHGLALQTLASKLPILYRHLCAPAFGINALPGLYLDRMFESLFTAFVSLDEVTRLWDVWAFEGDAVLVRAAIAVFAMNEGLLYGCEGREEVVKVLEGRRDGEGEGRGGKVREEEWMEWVREAGRSAGSGGSSVSGNGDA